MMKLVSDQLYSLNVFNCPNLIELLLLNPAANKDFSPCVKQKLKEPSIIQC